MAPSNSPRSNHRGTWFVVLFGLLEIGALVAFLEVKSVATTVCSFAASRHTEDSAAQNGGALHAGMLGGGPPDGGAGAPQDGETNAAATPPGSPSAASDASAQSGSDRVSGDTNQIVDPNCVAKTAAGLLSEGSPPPGPTCGPMKQPEALKRAESDLQK